MISAPTSRDRRARIGASGAYFVQGLCFAGLLTQVPTLQKKFGFTDGALTLILLVVPVVAGVGSLLAGALAPRVGSAVVLRVAGVSVCATITAIGFANVRPELYVAVAAFGLAVGAVDASMNMQGVAVQERYGRSVLGSFHGVWSVGVIIGSLSNSAAGALQLRLSTALTAIAVVGVAIALTAGPRLYHRDELATLHSAAAPSTTLQSATGQSATAPNAPVQGAPVQSASPAIPWRPLVLIGIAVMLMYISDSATSNWSAKYIEDVLHGAKSVGPLGLAAYATCQVLGRLLVADRAVHRFGPVRPVAVGGALGLVGMSLVAVAPAPGLAIAGFAIVGFGLCVVVPQSFSAAGALDPTGSGVAIARVNLFNYIGFILGAGLIGAVDQALGLRWAFAVPAVLCLGIIALSRYFRVATIGLGERAAGTNVSAPGSPAGTETASPDAAARAIADR